MPGGALVGTVVHNTLERVDFDAGDLEAAVADALSHEAAWHNLDLGDIDAVVAGLCATIESPLGAAAGGRRLRDVARCDRLDELSFELPLVGGDEPAGTLHVRDVADVLTALVPEGDPLHAYAASLRDEALDGVLRGYLNGSLDLVFRLPDGRFVLADYKSNKLAAPGEELTAWHYRRAALDAEMAAAHYPLQALLYAVALHRYLRWRLPGYDPAEHFGGIVYLFVRGMSALEPLPEDAGPCGVWSWCPSAPLIEALSDLFDRGAGS